VPPKILRFLHHIQAAKVSSECRVASRRGVLTAVGNHSASVLLLQHRGADTSGNVAVANM